MAVSLDRLLALYGRRRDSEIRIKTKLVNACRKQERKELEKNLRKRKDT